jgi:hypothetical protein
MDDFEECVERVEIADVPAGIAFIRAPGTPG